MGEVCGVIGADLMENRGKSGDKVILGIIMDVIG